ncbi:hypothetical protein SZN_29495 [Streptomyces zinciresistens K42]|uniref:Uncharacterized protein n=1 Tax=Streptomyces zinciresistens K42 TaxID=700597 RepID=G2GK56_9ACTN|nr:hypothetical protein SZN_29495 [Streptomyces zinciresistens K42]
MRRSAAAAAPYCVPRIEEGTGSTRVPCTVAAVTAVAGAAVVAVRRSALTRGAAEQETRHATEGGVTVVANRRFPATGW